MSISVNIKDQNSKISTGSYSFGYQEHLANGSLLSLSLGQRQLLAGTKKLLSCIGEENHAELAGLILIGRLLDLSEECKRKIRSGQLNESRGNLQYLAIPFAITPLPNI